MTMRMAAGATWRYLGRLFTYAPALSTLHALGWTLLDLVGLIPALVAQQMFNRLESGEGGITPLLLILFAVTLAQVVI